MMRRPHEEVPGVLNPLGILPGILWLRRLNLKNQRRLGLPMRSY